MAENVYDLEVASYKLNRQSLEEAAVDASRGFLAVPFVLSNSHLSDHSIKFSIIK